MTPERDRGMLRAVTAARLESARRLRDGASGPWRWRALVEDAPARRDELAVAAFLLTVLAVAAFGPHVRPGGFYNDDWSYLITARYPPEGGFFGAVANFDWLSFRPLMTLYWPFTFRVLGTDPSVHVAWTIAAAVLMATMLFALLRSLRFPGLHAGTISALALLMPVADSTRFWPAMSANVLAVCLYLGGVLMAVAGLRTSGRRSVQLHAAAVALYVASLLLYEIAASLVLATGLLYILLVGRRGLWRWAVDAGAAISVLALVTSHSFYDPLPAREQVTHAWLVAKQARWVLTETFWAPGDAGALAVVAVCVAVAAVLVAGWALSRRADVDDADLALRWWLRVALAAAVAAGAAYVVIVPSEHLSPRGAGQFNRANVLAGLGMVVLAYAVVMVAALLVTRRLRSWRIASAGIAAVASIFIAGGYVHQVREDQRSWEQAALEQRRIIDVIADTVRRPAPGSTVLTFGAPFATGPGVPVFVAVWDLAGAVRLRYDDVTLNAYPVVPASRIHCGAQALTLHNHNDAFARQTAGYEGVHLVDVPRAQAFRLRGRASCRAVTRRLLD